MQTISPDLRDRIERWVIDVLLPVHQTLCDRVQKRDSLKKVRARFSVPQTTPVYPDNVTVGDSIYMHNRLYSVVFRCYVNGAYFFELETDGKRSTIEVEGHKLLRKVQ